MNFDNIIYQLKKIGWLRFNLMSRNKRYGKEAIKNYKFLSESQWWSKKQLEDYQWQKLTVLVKHAYSDSPYYKRIFDENGIKPEDIKTREDYRRIPYITKDEVMQHLDEIKVRSIDQYKVRDVKTGGSTGKPLFMKKSQDSEDLRIGVIYRSLSYAGVNYYDVDLNTWSQFALDEEKEPLNYDPIHRTLNIRCSAPNEKRLQLFIKKYHEFKPIYFTGFFQFYKIFKNYLEKNNITGIKPKAIFVQGETFSEDDRIDLQNWYGCNIYDLYGMRENAVSACECNEGKMHINSEFTYIEFENNKQKAEPGELASIIGTNLHNYAMPLLRYYTGDMGYYFEEDCKCGRNLPLMKIEGGRSRDFIVTSEKLVFITHHLMNYLDINSGIEKIQVYQPNKERVIVRIVKSDQFTKQDEDKILEAIKNYVNNKLDVSIEYLDDIPHTRLGKYRMVISDVEAEI